MVRNTESTLYSKNWPDAPSQSPGMWERCGAGSGAGCRKSPVSPGCCGSQSIWHKMADLVYRQILPVYCSPRFRCGRMVCSGSSPEGGLWDDMPTAGIGRMISVSRAEGNLLLSAAGCVLLLCGICFGRFRRSLRPQSWCRMSAQRCSGSAGSRLCTRAMIAADSCAGTGSPWKWLLHAQLQEGI